MGGEREVVIFPVSSNFVGGPRKFESFYTFFFPREGARAPAPPPPGIRHWPANPFKSMICLGAAMMSTEVITTLVSDCVADSSKAFREKKELWDGASLFTYSEADIVGLVNPQKNLAGGLRDRYFGLLGPRDQR